MLGARGLTEKTTAFSDPDLVMAWAQAHAQGASAGRVRTLAARLARADGVEPVGEEARPGRPARYSTAELIALERRGTRTRRARLGGRRSSRSRGRR